jgi:hypothetical protein
MHSAPQSDVQSPHISRHPNNRLLWQVDWELCDMASRKVHMSILCNSQAWMQKRSRLPATGQLPPAALNVKPTHNSMDVLLHTGTMLLHDNTTYHDLEPLVQEETSFTQNKTVARLLGVCNGMSGSETHEWVRNIPQHKIYLMPVAVYATMLHQATPHKQSERASGTQ